ncbi:hypothetical protein [Halomonas sp.]|jgi:polyisoprenoid-binding protein YceI|uniref:hypothetical protein n=1 Tax=Halomonas sp. TaxID=1486246 RepID=UPI003563D09D
MSLHQPTSSRCRSLAAIIALAGTLALGSLPAAAEPHRYRIDPEHFSIGFLIGHLGYAMQLGSFLEGQGEFVYHLRGWQVTASLLDSGCRLTGCR